jgi:RNA polymerase sigma-70 factor (ECF subfamily)
VSSLGTVIPIRKERERDASAPDASLERSRVEDGELVERAVAGDRAAENRLARKHVPEVARVVARLLGTHDDVDDLVQETFLIAFEQLHRLEKPTAFRGWILRIAINKTRNAIRKIRMLRLLGLDRGTPDATLEALAHDHVSEELLVELAAVTEVLGRLPVECRIAWLLRHIEGHSLRDVGRLCGCSLATTKRRLARAHKRVMNAVDMEVLSRDY